MNLTIWDWKYRVGFCRETKEKVLKFIEHLDEYDKKFYLKLYEFHESHYSLDMLLNAYLNGELQYSELRKILNYELSKGLYIPAQLFPYYQSKIKNNFSKQSKKFLLEKLEFLSIYGKKVDLQDINRHIFGEIYDLILNEIKIIPEINRNSNEKVTKNVEIEFNEVLNAVKNDSSIIERFGSYNLNDFDINITEGNDTFAEWWEQKLINKKKDLLVLYASTDTLNKQDFEYTIYHEVFPGHGFFYQNIRNNNAKFDFGAMTLFEGWASYCEFFLGKTNFEQELLNRAKTILHHSLISKDLSAIYKSQRNIGYSPNYAISRILTINQYPNFYESYYLGALAINYLIKNNSPKEFINKLNNMGYLESSIKKLGSDY